MKRFLDQYWLLILSAFLLSLSRLPLHTGALVFIAFVPLLLYIDRGSHSARELLLAGLIFAGIQISVVFYWIATVTPGGLVGIWLLFALFYFLVFYLLDRFWQRFVRWQWLSFVALFISFEYLQNFGETRFPWFHISYALSDYRVLLQALDLGGVVLLALLILSINFLIFRMPRYKVRSLVLITGIFALWIAYGVYCQRSLPLIAKAARISVMQPCIPPEDKWMRDHYPAIISRYDSLTALASAQGAELIVYPEAAIPDYLMLIPGIYKDLRQIVQSHDISVFTGFTHSAVAAPEHPEPVYYYNAANLFTPQHRVQPIFCKNILVPIGERMLWLDYFPALWKLQFGQANWAFGTEIPRYYCGEHSFSPSICYELAFPHFMQRANFELPDGSLTKADYHVNITNDAWFGKSYGPWLHAVMTKYRAIESRIQIYRSANNGISMIVDPLGRVLSSAPLNSIQNIEAPLYTSPKIPLYHKLYPYPWLFVMACVGLYLLSFFVARRP